MTSPIERQARRYCWIAMATAALLVASVVGANLVIDPFATYRLAEVAGVNVYKPARHHRVRLVKAQEVRGIRPRGIVLGTSRSHLGLRPSHEGWDAVARPVYNLAFDGATTQEMYRYLRHAHMVQRLRQVVLGLDSYHATPAPAGTRADFDPSLLDAPGAVVTLPALVRGDLRVLSSLDTLRASVATIRSQPDRQPEWLAPDGQRLGHLFFRRPGGRFAQIGPRAYFEEIDRLEIGFKLEGRAAATNRGRPAPSPGVPEGAPGTSLEYIGRIVAFCRVEGIDLRIVITPEHAHQLELTAAIGEWATIENAKRALVELLADDAARYPNAPPIPLWDFSGYSSITTERLPGPETRAEMVFYWDSSHFKELVGDFMLDRVFGSSRPGRALPQDFGVQLTTENVEGELRRVRRDQAAYRRRHHEDVRWIEALVAGVRSRPGDSRVVTVR